MATELRVRRPEEVGPAIRLERVRRRVSVSELARASGVSRQWLHEVEAGRRASAPLDRLTAVLSMLRVILVLAPDPADTTLAMQDSRQRRDPEGSTPPAATATATGNRPAGSGSSEPQIWRPRRSRSS